MAIAQTNYPLDPTAKLTYETYLAEGEINRRYDIMDGERIFMTNLTEWHQDILGNILEAFRAYQRVSNQSKAVAAPRDVLITLSPLRTRVDVRECWIVAPEAKTVEVRHPGAPEWITVARYAPGEKVASLVFPGLAVPVDTIFAE